jgi:hypothetical protein
VRRFFDSANWPNRTLIPESDAALTGSLST